MTDQDTSAEGIVGKHFGEADTGEGKGPSVATQLVELASEHYDLGVSPDGEAFAIPKAGAPLVRTLRGGRTSLRAELAQAFYAKFGAVATQSALADACAVLEGQAAQLDPTELHLRVAEHDGALVLDLGDATGRAVLIRPGGWEIVDQPPVRFRRTALTGPLPEPERGGTLDAHLWPLLNVAEKYRPVLAAVLVSALLPSIPHPITALTGEQGTGKTSAARMISATLDPSPAQVRKAPRDVDTWTTAAAGSYVVALDNMSGIGADLSDALCRASTGDGDVRRRLYTDSDLSVIVFRRVVILTGIDLGDLAGDLADRLVTIGLERIGEDARRLDADLTASWERAHPRALGAVLGLAARVLEVLPTVQLAELPRMADYARVLAAVDTVLGTGGLKTYLSLRDELADDAMASDPVLAAIASVVTVEMKKVSAATLLDQLNEHMKLTEQRVPKDWPTKSREITTKLTRSGPAMRRLGWTVNDLGKDARTRAKHWHLAPPAKSTADDTTEDETREPAEDARNARNARTGDETAGQHGYTGASESASDTNTSSPSRSHLRPAASDLSEPDTSRSHSRSQPDNALTSTNGHAASDASESSDESAPSLSVDTWRVSGRSA